MRYYLACSTAEKAKTRLKIGISRRHEEVLQVTGRVCFIQLNISVSSIHSGILKEHPKGTRNPATYREVILCSGSVFNQNGMSDAALQCSYT